MGVRYMQEWEEKAMLIEEAEKSGLERGEKLGAERANQRLNELIQKLTVAGRLDDLVRSTTDKEFQKTLFEEFGL